jgi:hypothetical protein
MHKTHLPHNLSLPAFSVEKQETPDEEADAWQIVVSVQFCQVICGQCTVLSKTLWSVYSSVKQFMANVEFCQAICGKCTVLSSNLWPMYSSVKEFVANIQFCRAICGQCTVL